MPADHRVRRLVPHLAATAAAAAAALALAACTADGAADDTAAARSRTPSPSATPPQDICARLVTHWARDQLRPDGGSESDYQQKGLSDGQNSILLDVVEKAEAERDRNGKAAALALVEREVERRCDARYEERDGSPAPPGGWPS